MKIRVQCKAGVSGAAGPDLPGKGRSRTFSGAEEFKYALDGLDSFRLQFFERDRIGPEGTIC